MFYSHSLLSRKGPLGNIWMAVYCLRKLRRDQIAETDISSSVDKIMPEIQISYRLLAQLLLGIVRIFSKKVDYLYSDCNEALLRIRRSIPPTELATTKKASAAHRPQHMATREVKKKADASHKPGHEVTREVSRHEASSVRREEVDDAAITRPERFELDSFDLQIMEEGDSSRKLHEQSMFKEPWADERSDGSFLKERYNPETVARAEFNDACFTPVEEVLPCDLMDVDFEINRICNSSNLEERAEKLQGDSQHLEEHSNKEKLSARRSLAPVLDKEAEELGHFDKMQETIPCDVGEGLHVDNPNTQVEELIKLHDKALSGHLEIRVPKEKCSDAATPEKVYDQSNFLNDSGFTSPKLAVTTPARKERRSMLRKRKHFFDQTIVFSNEMLRLGIHDSSNLVCKRKKAPVTYLDAWKACKITNLERNLLDPLILGYSVELKALFEGKSCDNMLQKKSAAKSNIEERLPDKSSDSTPLLEDKSTDNMLQGKSTAESIDMEERFPDNELLRKSTAEPINMEERLPEKSLDDTPFLQGSFGDFPTTPRLSEDIRPTKSIEVRTKEPSPVEAVDFVLDLIDREPNYPEGKVCEQEDVWSVRTRAVAQYIYNSLLSGREHEGKEKLSLAQLLEPKTRSKCARFFYETLTLKSYGCIDIEQESPYADIIVSATPQLESMLKK